MATPVIMPRQGQSVETCIITQWFKQKGEQVKAGDLLFSYETDKAAFDEEVKITGTLLGIFFEEGDEVPVLTNVCVIGEEGESIDEFRPGSSEVKVETDEEEKDEFDTGIGGEVPDEKIKPVGDLKVSPRARKRAGELGVVLNGLSGSGPKGRVIERDVLTVAEKQSFITPLARKKMEKDHLIYNKERYKKGERVTSKDLVTQTDQISMDVERIPLSRVRKIIAENMYRSLHESAQITHHLGADARKIMELRAKVKKEMEMREVPNITLNDMVCFATVRALKQHSDINAHFRGDHIIRYRSVHLGFAVDTDRGLMVPVLKNAQSYSLPEFAIKMKDLAEKCQTGKIDPDLLSPSMASFTVSNLGAYGVEMFTPVLNLPQVGILGVNTIQSRPVSMGNGVMGFVPFIGLSLTYDHRAIDGAPASLFLQSVKEEIENFRENI